jgi:hypothetical protein
MPKRDLEKRPESEYFVQNLLLRRHRDQGPGVATVAVLLVHRLRD